MAPTLLSTFPVHTPGVLLFMVPVLLLTSVFLTVLLLFVPVKAVPPAPAPFTAASTAAIATPSRRIARLRGALDSRRANAMRQPRPRAVRSNSRIFERPFVPADSGKGFGMANGDLRQANGALVQIPMWTKLFFRSICPEILAG